MKHIPLTQGKFALVDDDDFERLNQRKWHVMKWGNTWCAGRQSLKREGKKKTIYMHREILGLGSGRDIQVDHINHNGLDNRRCNLRPCTCQQNQWNYTKASNKSSRYKGVSLHKSGGWTSYIMVN